MKSQPFDERNADDFDRITQLLTEAVLFISNNNNVKVTVTELSRISGVHRNTIYKRQWPIEKLTFIKDQRALNKMALARKKVKHKDPVSVLGDRLEKSRLEIVYWFNKFRGAEDAAIAFEARLARLRDARDVSLKISEERLANMRSLEAEIKRLRDVISILEAENAENSK